MSGSKGPRPTQRGPLLGMLLAALAGAGLLAYFGSRSAQVAGPSKSSAGPSSDAETGKDSRSAHRPPPSQSSATPRDLGPAAGGEAERPPQTKEEKEAYRGPDSSIDADVRDRGIDALVGKLDCIPPSKPFEKGRTGPGGVGCMLEVKDKPPVLVKRWAFRNPAGMLEVGDFENGRREGTWKQFHANGFVAAEGEFSADQRDGVWKEWDGEGHFFARRSYKNGRLDGVTVVFNGPEPLVEVYADGKRLGPDGKPELRPL